MRTFIRILGLLLAGSPKGFAADQNGYSPASAPFGLSKWAQEVSPGTVLPEYPRPMMERKDWMNLNGLWDYAVLPLEDSQVGKDSWQGKILVPFPIEAPLSGVGKRINTFPGRTYMNSRLWYRHRFHLPTTWSGQRVLLHFGAVDWEATVTLNGKILGVHQGGYDAFSFDVTDEVTLDAENELIVAVWDPTFRGGYPRGKQIDTPSGIWYTPCTGIWQTVWLEPVPEQRIHNLKIVPDIDNASVSVTTDVRGNTQGVQVLATVSDGDKIIARASGEAGKAITMVIPEPKLWWPDSPFLYELSVELEDPRQKKTIDRVGSYFGLRKISLGKDEKGINRILLNNTFVLQNGVLDQGYWPDGTYTAPTDEALRYDIEVTKQLGYNLSRKHLKIEPQRWYYWADKLGLLVWQDLVSTGDAPNHNDTEYATSDEHRQEQFMLEAKEVISERFNHPSIVMWVLFNEGMGLKGKRLKNNSYVLFDETKAFVQATYDLAAELDPTRLLNHESGMPNTPNQGRNPIDMGIGHVADSHSYGTTRCIAPSSTRASVIGEYHGPAAQYAPLVEEPGISGFVYTQITDVENERNGLLSYDRKKFTVNPETWRLENERHFGKHRIDVMGTP